MHPEEKLKSLLKRSCRVETRVGLKESDALRALMRAFICKN
jgi:hypothetical protein